MTNTFTLRVTFHGETKVFPLHTVSDAVWSVATGSLDGLAMDDDSYGLLNQFVGDIRADVPLYCFHEGMETQGYMTEWDDKYEETIVGDWTIGLDSAYTVSYDDVMAAIDAE